MHFQLQNLPVRSKILGSLGMVLLVLIILCTLAYRAVDINDDAAAEVLHTREVLNEIGALTTGLYEIRVGYSGYLLTGSPDALAPLTSGTMNYPDKLLRLQNLTSDNPTQMARWERLTDLIDTWINGTLAPNLALRNDQDILSADQQKQIDIVITRARGEFGEIMVVIGEAQDAEEELLASRSDQAHRQNDQLRRTLFVGGFGAIVLGLALTTWITRDVVDSLRRTSNLARELSAGNYGQRIGLQRRDEIGDTANALDTMASHLEGTISELDLARHRAELSDQRVTAILANMAEGIVIVGEHGFVESMNLAAQHMFGTEAPTAEGRSFNSLLAVEATGHHVDFNSLSASLANESPVQVSTEGRSGNSTFPVELILSRLPHNDSSQYVIVTRDITERVESDRQLRHQVEVADRASSVNGAVFDAAGEGMILIAPDLTIGAVNNRFAEMFAVEPKEVLGVHMKHFGGDLNKRFADPDRFRSMLWPSVQDRSNHLSDEFEQVWPEHRILQFASRPVHTGSDEYIGRLYAFRDVTREREVDRMKNDFVSMVSHELRTPLTSIKGYVDLLLEEEVGTLSTDQREFMEIVKNNAERLISLINDILDISRIEAGKINLNIVSVDVARAIGDIANMFRPLLDQKHQHLEVNVPTYLPPVVADESRLAQVLSNLVSNAHKYTPEGGSITISADMAGRQVRVGVSDTGVGLTEQEQSMLFTRFYRARNRATQETSGTGLGLAITQSLVELQGGAMRVESVPGQGSTFHFTLPVSSSAVVESEPPLQDPPQGQHILIVEDEGDISELLRRYLERAGYVVYTANSAQETLKLVHEHQFDLITLDVRLPDTDGFTLLEWLKQDSQTRDIPVMFLSMLPDDGEGRRLGAVDYVTKPIHESELVPRIGRQLQKTSGACILLADDDPDFRALVAKHLRNAGYRVIEATDGNQALDLAQQEQVDLALLDVRMPHLGGIEVFSRLRAQEHTAGLPVLLMTGSPGVIESTSDELLDLGITSLLNKRTSPSDMARSISNALRKKDMITDA